MPVSKHIGVYLSLKGLFHKHKIKYSVRETQHSFYFNVYVGDVNLFIRVSGHDQPRHINYRKPDFDLRNQKGYANVKKFIKSLKYNMVATENPKMLEES